MPLPRLAVICDLKEEGWPSMDLMGERLAEELQKRHADSFCTALVRPPMRRCFTRLPRVGGNLDRLVNRFWLYPRRLRWESAHYDLFHVVDHSYAHLAHRLPAGAAGVFCHDLDAFRCLLEPRRDPRPRWFQALARHTLAGLQKAAVVFHLSLTVRAEIERHGLVDPSRLVHAPPGVCDEFTPATNGQAAWPTRDRFLLHVGSCIPRKRPDVLLNTFAEVRGCHHDLRLVQVGGEWSPAQREQMRRLGIAAAVTQRRGLCRAELASLYRAAALVLLPSEAEGFGLPLAEALACGAVAVASDLPVLREVGGAAAVYCPVGDVAAWAATIDALLSGRAAAPALATRLAQARRYTWQEHARTVADAYHRLLGVTPSPPALG